jgi:transglutaminase-like putative cysteine protease
LAAETVNLDPDMPYKAARLNAVSYDVDFSVVVTPPYHTKILKVWLPIPQSDFGQEYGEGKLTTFPMEVAPIIGTEKVYGNKFAYFEFHDPHGAQVIRHHFKIKVWELRWNLDSREVVLIGKWPDSFDRYRRGENQAVVVNDEFRTLMDRIIPNRDNPLRDMAAVMNWTIGEFRYDHVDASLQASAIHALNNRHGHCSDYHGFCASMGRVLGSPTRVTYGIAAFPKNSPSHCKLEAFLPPYGWVSFDVSESQKLMAAIHKSTDLGASQKDALVQAAQDRLIHGFRENTWFLQTKGTDYELEPPASKRVAVVRTAYIEADGEPLPEPDPANREKREFSWMTVHRYTSDKPTKNAFKDFNSLGPLRTNR